MVVDLCALDDSMKMNRFFLAALCVGISGCSELNQLNIALGGPDNLLAQPEAGVAGPLSQSAAATAETLDQTTEMERTAAAQPIRESRNLGQTTASLGSAAEPGFWLKTPLVSKETSGQVTNPITGKSVAVALLPIEGPATAGSRISLAAMRILEVNLTDLVVLDVSL